MSKNFRKKGQSLIELLLAIGFAGVVLPALFVGFLSTREGKAQQNQRIEAIPLLEEAQEAVRSVREKGWVTFAINGTFHPQITGSDWSLISGAEVINGFTRSVVISDVNRDSNGNIVQNGGTNDPSTKKVIITVSWNTPLSSQINSITYITRHDNLAYTETTVADFNRGTKTNVAITNNSGGEVILSAGGGGNWCEPNLSISALDLPKSGVANAVTAIEGRAFAGTGENSSGVSFANVLISNTNPPVATVSGTFDGFKTNGVFGESNYAYLATDNNFKEIEIINLTTQPYSEAGYFDAPGNGNGNSIFVSGNVGYMTSGNKFYTFDLSSKSGSRPLLGSLTLDGTGTKVYVVGGYAYVAITGSTVELDIIQVGNGGTTLTKVGTADVNGEGGKDVFVNSSGTRAYLVTNASATRKEFFIIDVSTKTGNRSSVGSYEANGMSPKGVTVVPGNRAIMVGTNGEEYQVLDIGNETNPTRCGGLEINSGVNGVSGVLEQDGDAYAYIITGDSSTEFKIIEGGPGGKYAASGTFESATFDPGYQTAFNRFNVTFDRPPSTNIQFQVASVDAISGSCNGVTFTFVGPDGTGNTFFDDDSAIPISNSGSYKNPARCFRYKSYLSTSDNTQTPVLYDFTVNYSP